MGQALLFPVAFSTRFSGLKDGLEGIAVEFGKMVGTLSREISG